MPPGKVVAIDVKGACPYCQGDVLRGYKHDKEMQKCYVCHRRSWKGQVVEVPVLSAPMLSSSIKKVLQAGQGRLW